jgi:hypothetical protein
MVTADIEISPEDELGTRAALIEGFRQRAIYPEGVTSLAEESLVWDPLPAGLPPLKWEPGEFLDLIVEAATRLNPSAYAVGEGGRKRETESSHTSMQYDADDSDTPTSDTAQAKSSLSRAVYSYASSNAQLLMLDATQKIHALGVHPVFRVAPSGRLLIELVVQIAQRSSRPAEDFGGVPARGGTTLIVSFDGTVKYAIAKPLPGGATAGRAVEAAQRRLDRQGAYLHALSLQDLRYAYADEVLSRAELRATFKNLHLAR